MFRVCITRATKLGALGLIRTDYHRITSAVLYQVSYKGKSLKVPIAPIVTYNHCVIFLSHFALVPAARIELATYHLSGDCSTTELGGYIF